MVSLAEVAGDDDDSGRTFVFVGEDHTLGNALKSVISKYPEVSFCGYTLPHPTENKLYFRIQSNGKAVDLLKRGMEDLEQICNHTVNVFQSKMDTFLLNKTF